MLECEISVVHSGMSTMAESTQTQSLRMLELNIPGFCLENWNKKDENDKF